MSYTNHNSPVRAHQQTTTGVVDIDHVFDHGEPHSADERYHQAADGHMDWDLYLAEVNAYHCAAYGTCGGRA